MAHLASIVVVYDSVKIERTNGPARRCLAGSIKDSLELQVRSIVEFHSLGYFWGRRSQRTRDVFAGHMSTSQALMRRLRRDDVVRWGIREASPTHRSSPGLP